MGDPPDLQHALARFGHAEFRPAQREAIETLLDVGRLLLVAPTGGGKSLTYQLPASLLPGTALVISPLIALMNDQVRALEGQGIPATFLASTVPSQEVRRRLDGLSRGAYKLVYVAPERLSLPGFQRMLSELDVSLVAIDEAHCISEWGHDFRPEYLEIGKLLGQLPRVPVLACTATATPVVRDEILLQLGLPPDTPQLLRGFARPNLRLRARDVLRKADRDRAVHALLTEALGEPETARGAAIVYAPTRRATESEAERLAAQGWRADAYHAGLSGERRDRVQGRFLDQNLDIVVATNAFGMGIDRADVRAVVHLAPPGSVEAYYQEVGRAGRDGEPAWGLLLVAPDDLPRRRRLIQQDGEGGLVSPEVVEHKWALYLELLRWAEGGSCRHDAILRYFGDEAETLAGCGHCDVCEQLDAPDPASEEERTEIVRKALSAVARIHRRYGLRAAVNLLRGVADDRLTRSQLDTSPTFGLLRDYSDGWLMRLLQRCAAAGWVSFSGDERPVAELTEAGRAVMLQRSPARIVLPAEEIATSSPRAPRSRRPKREVPVGGPGEELLFAALRTWRQETARRRKVPAYVIAQDRSLREIASLRPQTKAALEAVWGLGARRVEQFGDELLRVVSGLDGGA